PSPAVCARMGPACCASVLVLHLLASLRPAQLPLLAAPAPDKIAAQHHQPNPAAHRQHAVEVGHVTALPRPCRSAGRTRPPRAPPSRSRDGRTAAPPSPPAPRR